MAKRAAGERERFWREVITGQASSGLSVSRYCRQSGVSKNSFYVWRRRLGARSWRSSGGPLPDERPRGGTSTHHPQKSRRRGKPAGEIRRRKGISAPAGALVPVRLIADRLPQDGLNAGAIEVRWPNGVVLRMAPDVNGARLREVLDALASALGGDAP